MLLREGEGYRPVEINITSGRGGLGDQISRVPAIKFILRTYPHVTIHLSVPDYAYPLFFYFFEGEANLRLFNWDTERDIVTRPTYIFNHDLHTTLGTHLVDYAFNILMDRNNIDMKDKSYPRVLGEPDFLIDRPYIVLTPGFTAQNRALPGNTWNYIAQEIEKLGYLPVWVGKGDVYHDLKGRFDGSVDYGKGLDLRDKTSLVEAARIMGKASCVVGLDNGLLHLAACTDVPLVAGYSSVEPLIRLPIREGKLGHNVVYIEPDTCKACESKVRFEYDVDFKYCYFADYRCTLELDGLKWMGAIRRALNLQDYSI